MHLCQSEDYGLILANGGLGPAADWLRDRDWDAADELLARPPFSCLDVYGFIFRAGTGSGRGTGRGFGTGSGIGTGTGSGAGIGRGTGSGRGAGSGVGSGIGTGAGTGTGIGRGTGFDADTESDTTGLLDQRCVMRVGKAYLIHLGDWHTFVGRVAEQIGPLTYALAGASKVDIQAFGDRWHELAAGDADLRRGATYWHYAGEVIVPLSIAAVEWAGATPQEAAGEGGTRRGATP